MVKSLIAGAAALGLIATAAFGQEAYDSTHSTTTQCAPPVAVAPPMGKATSTTVQTTTNPYTGVTVERRQVTNTTVPTNIVPENPNAVFDPSHVSSYHAEKPISPNGSTVEKSVTTETTAPVKQTTSWSQTTTRSSE